MATQVTGLQYSDFFTIDGGLYQRDDPALARKNKLREAKNIHIDGLRLTSRPGKRKWSNPFSGVFRGVYEYIDNVGNSHILVANNGKLYEVLGKTLVERDTGLDPEEDIYFTTLFGKCFYTSLSTQRKIELTAASDVGLNRPVQAPSAVLGPSGGLTGSYAWVSTAVIEDSSGNRLYESNPSPVSTTLNLSNQKVIITPEVSTDSRINARYIYRTYGSGNKYYYEGRIPNNTIGQSYTSGSVSDAVLGDEVEYNHAKPAKGYICEKCNNRLYWLVNGNMLYYSEIAETDTYAEYQRTKNVQGALINTAFYRLPNNGRSVALKAVYNRTTNQEDLYIFQERSVLRLPSGDPTAKIFTLLGTLGCVQQDTICEHNGRLFWLTNKNNVGMLSNDYYVDLTTQNIQKPMQLLLSTHECRAAVILDHYYALTTRTDAGKLYNNEIWICDLNKIFETSPSSGSADACWYSWTLNAHYLLQTRAGELLVFDSNDKMIYSLNFSTLNDENLDGSISEIEKYWHPVEQRGLSLAITKQPAKLFINGEFEKEFECYPYYYKSRVGASFSTVQGRTLFIMGKNKMGDPISERPKPIEKLISSDVVGNSFSFAFKHRRSDSYLSFYGYQYTYREFRGNR